MVEEIRKRSTYLSDHFHIFALFGTSTHRLYFDFFGQTLLPDLTEGRSKRVEVKRSKKRGRRRTVEVQKKCQTDAYPLIFDLIIIQ